MLDIVPFTVLYVYGRKVIDGETWVRCASNTDGKNVHWVPGALTTEFKQALTLLFAERADRKPLMFFKSVADLVKLGNRDDVSAELETLRERFVTYSQAGLEGPENFPVIAMEPDNEEGAVPYDRFYLMPILSFDDGNNFESVKLLEVASIDTGNVRYPNLGEPKNKVLLKKNQSNNLSNKESSKLAICFVIDTTNFMTPYIEIIRNFAMIIYNTASITGNINNIALGVIAYRSSTECTPSLDYVSKIFSPLRTAHFRSEFDSSMSLVSETTVSSHSFSEDSYAGLEKAIDGMDWTQYDARIILLITDAGSLSLDDKLRTTQDTAKTIVDAAKVNNINIVTFHIKSPAGLINHAMAEDFYMNLSSNFGSESAYIPIKVENHQYGAQKFEYALKKFIAMIGNMFLTFKNEIELEESEIFEYEGDASPDIDITMTLGPKVTKIAELLGYSVRLNYLDNVNEAKASNVVRSWIPDKDLTALGGAGDEVGSVTAAVLLTKNQLSAMTDLLKIVMARADESLGARSDDFFKSILDAASHLVRDPAQFALRPEARLADMGILDDFLEGLPYTSPIMGMTQEQWKLMDPIEQDNFVRVIDSLLVAYEKYDKDYDHWAKYDEPNSGEWLYRVPLSMLP
jgi:serine/threonine-protein kinase PpkA